MIKSLMIAISFMTIVQKGCGQVSTAKTNLNKTLNCSNCTPIDSAISKKLVDMNFADYQGKEVSVFLDDLGYKYESYIRHQKKPGYIWKIIFRYTDSLSIDIRVSDLNQTEKLDFGYTFDIEEFKKKKISMICFRYAGQCIKGCKGEPCYD